jgi:transcriptional regulator with XRE-family HTH domain
MSVSDVIRHNARRLRADLGLSQSRIAKRINARTASEDWTQFRISDIEGGRKGRERNISPEELITLAITFDVSVVELMTPPESITDEAGDERPVRVIVDGDVVSPAVFHRLAFLLGPEWRSAADSMHHGRDQQERISEASAVGWYGRAITEGIAARFPDTDWRSVVADEDMLVEVFRWVEQNYGRNMLFKIESARMRAAVLGDEEGEEE